VGRNREVNRLLRCDDPGNLPLGGCGKIQTTAILSEAKNLSLFLFLYLNRREILRFAQNDRTTYFFRSLQGAGFMKLRQSR
jgi:hypothetical protein